MPAGSGGISPAGERRLGPSRWRECPLPTVLATQAERTNSRVQAGQSAAVAQAAGRPTRTLPKRWDASSQAALLRRSAATVASGDCGAAEPMQERSPDQRRHNRSLRKKIAGRAVHRRRAVKGASVAEPASNRSICEPLAKPKQRTGQVEDDTPEPCSAGSDQFNQTWLGWTATTAIRADRSGPEPCRLDQTHLIATGGEFPTLIALDDNPTSGLDADHPGAHPAKGS